MEIWGHSIFRSFLYWLLVFKKTSVFSIQFSTRLDIWVGECEADTVVVSSPIDRLETDKTFQCKVNPADAAEKMSTVSGMSQSSYVTHFQSKKTSTKGVYTPAYQQKLVTRTLFVITVAFIISNMPYFLIQSVLFIIGNFFPSNRVPLVSEVNKNFQESQLWSYTEDSGKVNDMKTQVILLEGLM